MCSSDLAVDDTMRTLAWQPQPLLARSGDRRYDMQDDADELADQVAELDRLTAGAICWRLGEHRASDFGGAGLVVANPAVPLASEWLELAEASGARVTTEMGLFWELCPARTIAVTGSNGKSTTSAMIHSILEASGQKAWLGGNIGGSLLDQLETIGPDDWVVLELSSFQLEHLNRQHAAPDIAVVTNFTPNHLDRHGTLDAYRHAKQAILRWQSPDAVCVLSELDPDVPSWTVAANRLGFGIDRGVGAGVFLRDERSDEHTSELQSQAYLVCRRLL